MKTIKRFYFIQDWGPWKIQTFVAIRYLHDDIIKIAKKVGTKKYFIDFLEKKGREEKEDIKRAERANGYFLMHPDTGASVIWMPEWTDDWWHYEVLIHELHHAIFLCSRVKGMENEMESQAYQIEHLFKEIRRRLTDKLNKLKKT